MSSKLPIAWRELELGKICNIIGGKPAPQKDIAFSNEGIPFVRMQDLGRYHHTTNLDKTKDKISKKYAEENGFNIIKKGAILIPRSGSVSLNHRAILGVDAFIVSHICALIIVDNQIDITYFYYVLRLYDMRKIMTKTTGLDAISFENLRKIKLKFPSIKIQQKIVSILEKAEKAKELRNEADELTKDYLKSVFVEMFGDLNKNNKCFPVCSLSDVCEINPRKSEVNEEKNKIVSFMAMADIGEEGQIYNIALKEFNNVKTGFTYFKKNDVLFAKITPCMENGKGAIAKINTEVGFGSTEFHVLRPIKGKTTSEWIYYLLSLKQIREEAEKKMTGSAGQKRVPTGFFDILKIPIPPIELQQKFASIVEQVESMKGQQKESKENLDNLFNVLMQKAFKGELIER